MGEEHDERWKDYVDRELEKHDGRLSSIEGFQKWQMGAAMFLMWVFGFISDKIKHVLGLG